MTKIFGAPASTPTKIASQKELKLRASIIEDIKLDNANSLVRALAKVRVQYGEDSPGYKLIQTQKNTVVDLGRAPDNESLNTLRRETKTALLELFK